MNFWKLVTARVEKWAVKYKKGDLPTKIRPHYFQFIVHPAINDTLFVLDAATANSTNRTKWNFYFCFSELRSNNRTFFYERKF
jgi:hypothetical protein